MTLSPELLAALREAGLAVDPRAQRVDHPRACVVDRLHDELAFAAVVIVEDTEADAGPPGDLAHGGSFEAFFGDDFGGGAQDFLAAPLLDT